MNKKGFSAIELLITTVIIALLAVLMVVSYKHFIQRGKRAEAFAMVQELALLEEKAYQERGSYVSRATLQDTFRRNIDPDTKYWDFNLFPTTDTGNNIFLIWAKADPLQKNNVGERRPCIKSDNIKGFCKDASNKDIDCTSDPSTCVQEEWK